MLSAGVLFVSGLVTIIFFPHVKHIDYMPVFKSMINEIPDFSKFTLIISGQNDTIQYWMDNKNFGGPITGPFWNGD